MNQPTIEVVIEYIYQNMSAMAGELDRLKTDLDTTLANEDNRGNPELLQVFSGYMLTIQGYASVLKDVCHMLQSIGACPDLSDPRGHCNLRH